MEKDLVIRKLRDGSGYTVHYEKGGELPAQLQGEFTKYAFAEEAISAYLATKVKRNVTTKAE
jgi:hypothetical protein